MSNLQIKYDTLCTLAVEQLFYSNKVCKKYRVAPILDLDIVPVAETSDLMRRMDLVFRRTDEKGGIVLLARVEGSNAAGDDVLRFPAMPADKLSFGIILKNPGVLVQNDLPVQNMGSRVYYFSNETVDAAASRSALHLSKDAGGVGAPDIIGTAATQYRYHAAETVAAGSAVVKHLLTGKTASPVSLVNQDGEADLFFNLASLPSGKCSLLIGGAVKDTFYYAGSSLGPSLFGVVEIMLSSSLGSNYRVIEPDRSLTKERPAFLVTFKNRRTVWRYTFQLYPNSPLYLEMAALSPAEKASFTAALNIISNDTAVTFKQTHVTDSALVFESETALLLQEAYSIAAAPPLPLKLSLEKNIGGAGEAVVRDNLPYPSPQLIDVTSSFIYSDIFITI